MISKTPFEGFQPKFEVASCFVEVGGKFLMLLRQDTKSEGNKWGVPAGKVEQGESIEQALVREIKEEINLDLAQTSTHFFDTVYVRYPEYDFVYDMFRAPFGQEPEITLNLGEHKDSRWASPYEALRMNLVQDEDVCIKLLYGNSLEKLIAESIARASTLDEIYAAIAGVFYYLREDWKHPQLGYVSGVVSSDSPAKIEENLARLHDIASQLQKTHTFPIFSPPDIFSKGVLSRVEQAGVKGEDFIQFWRSVLMSGYVTDIFMTRRWQESRGATDEHKIALQAGLQIHYLKDPLV